MRLSANPIITFSNVNSFAIGNQWTVRAGDPLTLYFQIVDLDQSILVNIPGQNLFFNVLSVGPASGNLPGLRYMLGVGSQNQPYGITVTFPSIDNASKLQYIAVQADANDSSIWKVSIPSSQVPSGGAVQFAIAEGNSIRRFSVLNMIAVESPTNDGSC
jgi:hypothetical protein